MEYKLIGIGQLYKSPAVVIVGTSGDIVIRSLHDYENLHAYIRMGLHEAAYHGEIWHYHSKIKSEDIHLWAQGFMINWRAMMPEHSIDDYLLIHLSCIRDQVNSDYSSVFRGCRYICPIWRKSHGSQRRAMCIYLQFTLNQIVQRNGEREHTIK